MKKLFCDGLRQFELDFSDPQVAYYVMSDVLKYGVKDDLHFCELLAEQGRNTNNSSNHLSIERATAVFNEQVWMRRVT